VLRTIRTQSVAEHSYYVAVYCMLLGEYLQYTSDEINFAIRHALIHDVEEIHTGDIPSPTKFSAKKKDNPFEAIKKRALRILGLNDKNIWPGKKVDCLVKLADLVESLMYLSTEEQLGNGSLLKVFMEIENRVDCHIAYMSEEGFIKNRTFSEVKNMIAGCARSHKSDCSNHLRFGEV
jgi:5'-deoxynucleotidase YfbR-like HD superfamily hydrolase